MIGYWDPKCPVKTGRGDVVATVYVGKDRALISLASWAKARAEVSLQIDWAKLGLDLANAQCIAPAISSFQPRTAFDLSKPVSVDPGKGWLIVIERR